MNEQQIFDTVAAHLFRQGRRAMDGSGCRYRSGDGLKCAVGCFIPDEAYDPDIEGVSCYDLRVRSLLPFKPDDYTLALLHMLQGTHDNRENWVDTQAMREALARVAERFKLSFVPENYQFSDRRWPLCR